MNPPCRNPTDKAKYRQQYLSNLLLQASNNQKNLNANVIFKQTGQSPSQPTDFRTPTEKFADTEGMKREVRSFISSLGFTNSTGANEVVQSLDPEDLLFIIGYKLFITTDFKGRGVPAIVFENYVRKLRHKYEQTDGVEMGLQQETGENILLSNQQILNEMPSRADLNNFNMKITALRQQLTRHNDRIEFLIENLGDDLRKMGEAIPTDRELQRINQLPPSYVADIQRLLNNALADIPTKGDIQAVEQELFTAIKNHDENRVEQILSGMRETFSMERAIYEELTQVKEMIRQATEEEDIVAEAVLPPEERMDIGVEPNRREKKIGKEQSIHERHIGKDMWNNYNVHAKREFLKRKLQNHEIKIEGLKKTTITNMGNAALNELHTEYLRQHKELHLGEEEEEEEGHGLSGKGLCSSKKQIRNYVKTGALDGVIEKPKPYVPFGRYVINKHKLKDNIVMIRRPCGNGFKEMPSHRVSGNISQILKGISGGIIPHIDHITGMGIKDQEHLHRILKFSHIDNVPVPTPKNDNQKENDRFDILKGEIMAGNDNKTLIREFKVLLMRFITQGRIPRREGHEILTDLTSMGF